MLTLAIDQCPDLTSVVLLGSDDWSELLSTATQSELSVLDDIASTLRPDDPINIQYTSGTTGFPKGATLSHRNILNNGYFCTEQIRLTAGDRLCIPVPFYHCFGMVMGNLGCTTHGATIVIPASAFDPGQTLAAHEKDRCTAGYGVPKVFIARPK